MNDQSKQIISDSESVTRFTDREMLKILNSHSLFTIAELLEKLQKSTNPTICREKVDAIFVRSRSNGGYSKSDYFNDLQNAILSKDTNLVTIVSILLKGTSCSVLQPDGTGWQKGNLKLCFEFTPEENKPVPIQKKSVEAHRSPLDEIRQLANELTSEKATGQN
jgi:hypothetical protein